MKPMRIHHVGVVLPDRESVRAVMDLLGLEVDYCGFVEAYNADLIFTRHGPQESPIEFIIPRGGVLADYNNGKGGIAHIAFEVDDVEAVREEMEARGLQMLEKKAVQGTDDIVVNFLRPRHSQGILFEFVQTVAPIKR
ncbi:MAG: VOC family protein [Desulfovibrio sp.]|jgi:lactoylglutathione lyase/methylmalonyl-CoA/ethylmalonyl-CoA epimerase|nr:VOC family protein [Desulfovibrio sp.]